MFEIAWRGGPQAALAESLALQAANGMEAKRITLLIVTHGGPTQVHYVVDPDDDIWAKEGRELSRGEVSAAEVVRVEETR
jgi:hypothetical protein